MEKVDAVVNTRPPQNVSQVRFLLRKGQSFVWERKHPEAFEKLKMMMTNADAHAHFRNHYKARIVAYLEQEGIGIALIQLQKDHWGWCLVSYASRNFSDVES